MSTYFGPVEIIYSYLIESKYGNLDQQLRALNILDTLIENAGSRFQRSFADEPLLERLRVCATDTLSVPEVKGRCQVLFRQWAAAYKSTPGMERVVALQQQLPKRKKPVTQQQSKVLKETEPNPNEDPFSDAEDRNADRSSANAPPVNSFASSSTPSHSVRNSNTGLFDSGRSRKKSIAEKNSKKSKHRGFDLGKEKPQILQAIASSSMASTNLMNALKLIDRERKRVSEDAETVLRFESCKQLRRQILRYIQHIESEQWLGSLINANDALIEALMAYEVLDKSVEDDSDSEGVEWSDDDSVSPPNLDMPKANENIEKRFAGLSFDKQPEKALPALAIGPSKHNRRDEEHKLDEAEAEDDDPFADSNEIHTPKTEKGSMNWRDV